MIATETKTSTRQTNEQCHQRGIADGIEQAIGVLKDEELKLFRRAAEATAAGKAEEAMTMFACAQTISAAIVAIQN